MVLISGVVAQDIHIKARTFPDHGLANAAGADHRDRLAADLIAQKRQKWMPRPPPALAHQLLTIPKTAGHSPHHEEGELRSGLGQHVGGVGNGYLVAVGIHPADVVEAHGNLRHNFQRAFTGFKDLVVNRIAERRNEAVDPGTDSFKDQRLGRGLRPRIYLDVIASFSKPVKSSVTNMTSSKYPKFLRSHAINSLAAD